MLYTPFPGIVVQSVRAPPCQGGSCGFEPRQSRPRIRWIHQLISPFSAKRGDKEQDLIPGGSLFLSCFSFRISHRTNMGLSITSTSTDWWERDICGLVQFIIYWHIQDSKRDWVWFFNPIHVCNGIEYLISFYREHIHKWNSFLVRYKMNFTQLHYP